MLKKQQNEFGKYWANLKNFDFGWAQVKLAGGQGRAEWGVQK